MVGILSLFAILYGLKYNWSLWRIEIKEASNENNYVLIETYIEWIYVPFIDVELPYLCQKLEKNQELIFNKKDPVLFGEIYSESKELEAPSLEAENNESVPPEYITEEEIVSAIIFGLGLSHTIFTIFMGILGAFSDFNKNYAKWVLGITVTAALILGFGLLHPLSPMHEEFITLPYIFQVFGFILGMILVGFIFFIITNFIKKGNEYSSDIIWSIYIHEAVSNIVIAIIGLVFLIIDIYWVTETFLEELCSLITLVLIPAFLTAFIIALTISDKSNIDAASRALIFIGAFSFVLFAVFMMVFLVYLILNLIIFIFLLIFCFL